jgi:hypothetical protein
MTDIVKRLLECPGVYTGSPHCHCKEAAAEIERLRQRIHSQELEVVRLQREKDAIGRELARRVLEPKP